MPYLLRDAQLISILVKNYALFKRGTLNKFDEMKRLFCVHIYSKVISNSCKVSNNYEPLCGSFVI